MPDSKIGGAYFELSTNKAAFDADMKSAEVSAKSATDSIGSGFSNANARVSSFGGVIKDATSGLNTLVSAGSRVLGLVGILTTAASALGNIVNKQTQDAVANMQAYRDVLDRVAQIQDRIANMLGEGGYEAYARQQNNAYREMAKELQAIYDNPKLSSKSKDSLLKEIQELYKGPGGVFQTIDKLYQDSIVRGLYNEEQRRMEVDRQRALSRKNAANEELRDFLEREREQQEHDAKREREQRDADKRAADYRLKLELDNIKRAEDYRRSLTQGFGVGDVASSDLSALVDAMKQVTSNQISSRD